MSQLVEGVLCGGQHALGMAHARLLEEEGRFGRLHPNPILLGQNEVSIANNGTPSYAAIGVEPCLDALVRLQPARRDCAGHSDAALGTGLVFHIETDEELGPPNSTLGAKSYASSAHQHGPVAVGLASSGHTIGNGGERRACLGVGGGASPRRDGG